jgi:polysaccharide biosynthesis protein PslF
MAVDLMLLPTPRWAVMSTYPPTACGLATFTHALVGAMSSLGTQPDVIQVVDEPQRRPPGRVVHQWVSRSAGAVSATAAALNRYDVVLVQHEYGIYPGPDGEQLLDVLNRLRVPVVTVLHTVLGRPTTEQRLVLEGVIAASDVLVTMTQTARDRVIGLYRTPAEQVRVIPHGAPDALALGVRLPASPVAERPARDRTVDGRERRPVILTWGLLGQGKGIEWGIEALSRLQDLVPRPVYVVAGRTHPKVLEREGERYRRRLRATAERLGVAEDVRFDDRYLDAADLHRLIRSADVVLLPYDSVEQVTSGVLIEAVAAGRPVVSSSFPHATELLGDGTGLLVERQDPDGIAAAVRQVLTEPGLAGRLSRRAGDLAPDLSWSAVAGHYLQAGEELFESSRATRAPGRDTLAVVS